MKSEELKTMAWDDMRGVGGGGEGRQTFLLVKQFSMICSGGVV